MIAPVAVHEIVIPVVLEMEVVDVEIMDSCKGDKVMGATVSCMGKYGFNL